jgi:hypothetical protein
MNKTIVENVKDILRNSVEARNSDKELMVKYWEKFDNINMSDGMMSVKAFVLLSTPSGSIVRSRRLIQSNGEFLPTDESVIRMRKLREVAMMVATTKGAVV